jgi:nucleoside-diphosphate-sugar epimerase
MESNIAGAYNILRAAKDAGCKRVVLAGSIQAVDGYPLDEQVRTDSPVRPLNMYGAAKCFMEAAAHCFAASEGLSCIVVRVGHYQNNYRGRPMPRMHARNLSAFVSVRDLCELFIRALEVENVPFAIVHGISDNRFKRLDMSTTNALLGYRPQDDAFRMFGVDLLYTDQWIRKTLPTAGGFTTDLSKEA